ncbi:cytochrome o ubiquinol oxidase subunit 1 [Bradyrhizobium diazoefficiens]
MLGKLDWSAIPFDQPIPLIAGAVVLVAILAVLVWVVVKGHLPYLWHEWITSVDHKRIGVMYILLASIMLLRGGSDAIMMRIQQAVAYQSQGYLPPEHYNQIFSAHGTIMIFFVAMPFVIGLMNLVVPLQLGVRDVAFPTLNSVGFWLTATGALLVNLSLVIGEFARTGWLAFPPLSGLSYSPGVGVDYYAWSLQISGVGTLVAGINLVTTVLKLRTKGMNYLRMPMFCWTTLASNLLIVAAFPILTATLAMLLLDRYLGFHFFTNEAGGNVMMFMNLIWAWGHPEVYILVLPAFGIFSEVVSTFSGKALFGYRSMVLATMAICVISFMVWLHHFFTMGAGPDVNAIFGIASMIIAVPTGVKIYNWLFTMYGGRIRFATPMLWAVGFMVTFIIGGLTGVLVAVPPADFMLHNSMFLVAHFHNVIIGGVLFGAFAGFEYWFPKAFGFRLDERWGKLAFWFTFLGFYVTFMPLYIAGMLGMTRRLQHYDVAAWAALDAGCGGRHGRADDRCDLPDHAARRQHQESRGPARPHRRSLGRAFAGMGDLLAAAGLQLRFQSRCARRGCLLGHEDPCPAAIVRARCARISRHRNAAEFPDRLHLRVLRHHHGLCADLAHLVDGDPGRHRRVRDLRRVRLARP